MNILITGSKGFIAQHLIGKINNEYRIIKLINGASYSYNEGEIVCNLLDLSHIEKLLKEKMNIDIIIHTASKLASSGTINQMSLLYDNIKMYEHLTKIIVQFSPKKILNFSSIAVYPNEDGEYFENSQIRPSLNNDCLYGLSKFCGENILDFFNKQTKIVHLRISQVHGEGMRDDRIFTMMQNELEQKNQISVFGNGRRISNFIDIDTLTQKIFFFIEHEEMGVFNVGDKNLSYKDIASDIISKYGNNESKIVLFEQGVSSQSLINSDKLKEIEANDEL